MSTRGLFGFKHQNQYYGFYNHHDSYPEGLGREMIYFYFDNCGKENLLEILTTSVLKIKKDSSEFLCDLVPDFSVENAFKFLTTQDCEVNNEIDFLADSLFCEYAYILDFENKQLLCFKGYQCSQPGDHEIYHSSETLRKVFAEGSEGYYPCTCRGTITFNGLSKEEAIDQMEGFFKSNEELDS
jgi:hypothetical protein